MEGLTAYERRLLEPLKKYSPKWKDTDLYKIATDSTAFGIVRDQIFEEARADGGRSDLPAGELRRITKTNPETGLRYYEYVSSGGTFIGASKPETKIARLNPTPGKRLVSTLA
jgi:hypothetical protein